MPKLIVKLVHSEEEKDIFSRDVDIAVEMHPDELLVEYLKVFKFVLTMMTFQIDELQSVVSGKEGKGKFTVKCSSADSA
jgi:hypothetical protein